MQVSVGKGIELDVDTSRLGLGELPTGSVAFHIMCTGLRNILMDAHASATAKADPNGYIAKSRELVDRKLAALYAGEIRTTLVRGPTDPLAAEMRKLAFGIVQKLHADELATVPSKDRLAKIKQLADKHAADHADDLRPIAERRVREVAELAGLGIATPPEAAKPKKAKRAA